MQNRPVDASATDPDHEVVEDLQRWQDTGAIWRVLSRARGGQITVGLFSCDGGEEVARISSSDARLVTFVANRDSSED